MRVDPAVGCGRRPHQSSLTTDSFMPRSFIVPVHGRPQHPTCNLSTFNRHVVADRTNLRWRPTLTRSAHSFIRVPHSWTVPTSNVQHSNLPTFNFQPSCVCHPLNIKALNSLYRNLIPESINELLCVLTNVKSTFAAFVFSRCSRWKNGCICLARRATDYRTWAGRNTVLT